MRIKLSLLLLLLVVCVYFYNQSSPPVDIRKNDPKSETKCEVKVLQTNVK